MSQSLSKGRFHNQLKRHLIFEVKSISMIFKVLCKFTSRTKTRMRWRSSNQPLWIRAIWPDDDQCWNPQLEILMLLKIYIVFRLFNLNKRSITKLNSMLIQFVFHKWQKSITLWNFFLFLNDIVKMHLSIANLYFNQLISNHLKDNQLRISECREIGESKYLIQLIQLQRKKL